MVKQINKSKKFKQKQLLIILVLILCTITLVSSLGRYVANSINNFFLRSKDFYFFSDKLKENIALYQIDNWTGIDDYTITVNMNSMENSLKKTNYDIDYEISYVCSENAICQLSKEQGTITASKSTDYFNLQLTPSTGLKTGDQVWVEITAKSITNYTKTLKAKFTLVVGQESLSYEIVDQEQSKYLDLNITNTLSYYNVETAFGSYAVGDKIDVDTYLNLSEENKEKCYSAMVTLEFNPNEVLLDMTNTNYLNAIEVLTTQIGNSNYINSITFKVAPISSTVVRFYKINVSKDYTYPIVNTTSIIELTSR